MQAERRSRECLAVGLPLRAKTAPEWYVGDRPRKFCVPGCGGWFVRCMGFQRLNTVYPASSRLEML